MKFKHELGLFEIGWKEIWPWEPQLFFYTTCPSQALKYNTSTPRKNGKKPHKLIFTA
jgi:hypothetical protein